MTALIVIAPLDRGKQRTLLIFKHVTLGKNTYSSIFSLRTQHR